MKKRLLLILLITIISSLVLPATAMAEVKEETGIKVERSVDVISGDKIEVTLKANAKEGYDLSNVTLVNQTPKGYKVVSGDSSLNVEEIKSGETTKLSTVFAKDVSGNVTTGDNNGRRLLLYGAVAVLSILLSLIILRKTKRVNKALMLILCFSIVCTGALAISGTAIATSNSAIKLSKELTVGNEQVRVDSLVNYGKVSENTGVLTYDANGHGTVPEAVTMKYTAETKAASAPSEKGYKFEEWNTSADGKGTSYTAGSIVKAANKTAKDIKLYAQWKDSKAKAILTNGKTLYFVYDTNEYEVKGSYNSEEITDVYTVPVSSSKDNPAEWINNSNIDTAKFEESFAKFKPTTTVGWFAYCNNLSSIKNIDNLNTSKLTDISAMFYEAGTDVEHLNWDLSNWNLPNVTNMQSAFQGVGKNSTTINLNLSNVKAPKNTSLLATFYYLGQYAKKSININVSGWETGSVEDMESTFDLIGSNVDSDKRQIADMETVTITGLEKWDTSNVTKMLATFCRTGQSASTFDIGDLSKWNTSKVKSMTEAFYFTGYSASSFNIGDLSKWDTSNVTRMFEMFYKAGYSASTFNVGNLSNWNTSNVTNMSYMFNNAGYSASSFNIGDLSKWNTSNVKEMSDMFNKAGYSASSFNIGDLSKWNTSNVTNMSEMFYYAGYSASSFNIGDLSKWNTSNVTNMEKMFNGAGYSASTFNIGNLDDWNTLNVTDMLCMFYNAGYSASTFNIGDLSKWNTSNSTNMRSMFYNAGYSASSFNIGNLDDWNTSNVTDMAHMFNSAGYSASTYNIGNLDDWNTSNVTEMSYMFNNAGYSASTFNIGDLSKWNTSNVKQMRYMFCNAGSSATTKTDPKVSGWNVDKVKDYPVGFNRGAEWITPPTWKK